MAAVTHRVPPPYQPPPGDPDPRPVIAAKLDSRMRYALGYASTERILNERIPEGAPWTATWEHGHTSRPRLASVQAGGVTAWLARHPEDAPVST